MQYADTGITRLNTEEKNQIVKDFLPQIKVWVMRAKSTLPDSVDIDELYSAAALGLIECLEKYDKSRNVAFGTYVEYRVKGAMLDALRGMDFLSRNARTKLKAAESAVEQLKQKLGRMPIVSEVADFMGIDENEAHSIFDLQSVEKPVSLDNTVGDSDSGTLIEYIKSDILSPEEETIRIKLTELMGAEIDKLPEKERLVVSLYYYDELTMKEIAAVLDITESRVSQLHSSAMKKMKKRLKDLV